MITQKTKKAENQKGFTLIELSIVLVIIGLIVGGVLVGQDLIHAAEIRATVSQIEKYDAATNTFRSKYNGLPGDLPNSGNFFADITSGSGAAGLGDGDGLIAASAAARLDGETQIYWRELQDAGLTADAVTTVLYTTVCAAMNTDACAPAAKMGKGNRFAINSASTHNYFIIAAFTSAAGSAPNLGLGLTPTEALQIDTKLDDGNPTTGTVISMGSGAGSIAASTVAGSGACYSVVAGTPYNVATFPSTPECVLSIRTAF